MEWSGINLNGRRPLYIVQGSLTGLRYRDETMRPLYQPAPQAMGPGTTLQDDNVTPHRARVVTDFLQQQGIPRMDWPARSPDLAPIQHILDVLGRRVAENHHHPPLDVNQLTRFLQ